MKGKANNTTLKTNFGELQQFVKFSHVKFEVLKTSVLVRMHNNACQKCIMTLFQETQWLYIALLSTSNEESASNEKSAEYRIARGV